MKQIVLTATLICAAYVGFLAGSGKYIEETGSFPVSPEARAYIAAIVFVIAAIFIAKNWWRAKG